MRRTYVLGVAGLLSLGACGGGGSGGSPSTASSQSSSTTTTTARAELSREAKAAVLRCTDSVSNTIGISLMVASDDLEFREIAELCDEAAVQVSIDDDGTSPEINDLFAALERFNDALGLALAHFEPKFGDKNLDKVYVDPVTDALRALESAAATALG